MTRARLRQAAIHDIREIRIYTKANHGASATKAYLTGLSATLDFLADRPLAGRQENSLHIGLRSFGFRSHHIYYQVTDDTIDVLRVLHQAQDVAAQLHPE